MGRRLIEKIGQPVAPSSQPSGLRHAGVIALLVIATLLAYANSFGVPFVFDDYGSILQNPTILHLSSIGDVLSPPVAQTVGGRPLLNLTLALNYAISGFEVWSYHALNLLIHLSAGLALFGIVRRTLLLPKYDRAAFQSRRAMTTAALTSLLFLLHPLQTEAVTYIIQRAESMVSMWYLITLYCFIRAATSDQPGRWQAFAILSCALGMATKEVMVTVPFVVLMYDRFFLSRSFREALTRRRYLYLGLASTWIILLYLVQQGGRGDAAGYAARLSPLYYFLTQIRGVIHYLMLVLWPHPLVFDYGFGLVGNGGEIATSLALLVIALIATIFAAKKWPAIGFCAIAFVCILAPSSSIIPIAGQTIAEHRMYLALSALLVTAVSGLYLIVPNAVVWIGVAWAAVLGGVTVLRNQDYQSERKLWEVTLASAPNNPRASVALGYVLASTGEPSRALELYRSAVQLDSTYVNAQVHLADFLAENGTLNEAISHYQTVLHLAPELNVSRFNLATAMAANGDVEGSLTELREVARRDASFPGVHAALSRALIQTNRYEEALVSLRETVGDDPRAIEPAAALGDLLIMLGKYPEAIDQLTALIRIAPDYEPGYRNLGEALGKMNRRAEAIVMYQKALALAPNDSTAIAELKALQQKLVGTER